MDIKKILRFLFPEYQIIAAIKMYGFVRGSKLSIDPPPEVVSTVDVQPDQLVPKNHALVLLEVLGDDAQTNETPPNHFPIEPTITGDIADIADITEMPEIQAQFYAAEVWIKKRFLGQDAAVDQLLMALKRPFVDAGIDEGPKNTIFICGTASSGRHTLLNKAANSLARLELFVEAKPHTLDLARYPTAESEAVFLSDLYTALMSSADVVAFENYQQCHSRFTSALSELVCTRKYTLHNRYALQEGQLLLVTGMLMTETISMLSGQGKYFVFITSDNKRQLDDFWGGKFMAKARDIVVMEAYSEDALAQIIQQKLTKLAKVCKKNLQITIHEFPGVVMFLQKQYHQRMGIGGIEETIKRNLYEPLAEYKLRHLGKAYDQIIIGVEDDDLVVRNSQSRLQNRILLAGYTHVPHNDLNALRQELEQVVGLKEVKAYILDLENHANIAKMREAAGYKNTAISKHMIFTGILVQVKP